jgi:hypothetical protein
MPGECRAAAPGLQCRAVTDEEPPRRRSWRRRVASLAVLIGVLVLGNYLCLGRDQPSRVEIHYRMGDPPVARSLAVDVKPRGKVEVVANFRRDEALPDTVHRTTLRPGLYDLEITLTDAEGRARTVVRPIEARAESVVTVDLSGEKP